VQPADHSFRGVLPGVCEVEASTVRRAGPDLGCCATERKNWRRREEDLCANGVAIIVMARPIAAAK
jgi:hypothetical protein